MERSKENKKYIYNFVLKHNREIPRIDGKQQCHLIQFLNRIIGGFGVGRLTSATGKKRDDEVS